MQQLKKYAILLTAALSALSCWATGNNPAKYSPRSYIGQTAKAATAVIYLPQTEKVYEYENGVEKLAYTYTYKYDSRGNCIEDYNNGSRVYVTFNEHNMLTERRPQVLEEQMLVLKYDPVVTDFITERQTFDYDDLDGDFTQTNYHHRIDIRRDEQGKVTGWSRMLALTGSDQLDEVARTTITYGENGQALTWKLDELTLNDQGELYMKEDALRYDNMQWQNTDHQIVTESDGWLLGANRLKSADQYVNGEKYGTLTVEYTNREDFVSVYTTTDGLYIKHTYRLTDANGSYWEGFEEEGIDKEGNEYRTTDHQEMTFDAHGNMTQHLVYVDEEMQTSSRRAHTYDADGRLTQTIEEMYETQTKTWSKIMRMEFSDHVGVTPSGIDMPAAPSLQAFVQDGRLHLSGADMTAYTLYSTNGTAVASGHIDADRTDIDLSTLGSGLYIAAVTTAQGTTAQGTTAHVKFIR